MTHATHATILPRRRRRVQLTLTAHVVQLGPDRYQAEVRDSDNRQLWASVPLPAFGIAEYLGWTHLAALATRLQEFGEDPD